MSVATTKHARLSVGRRWILFGAIFAFTVIGLLTRKIWLQPLRDKFTSTRAATEKNDEHPAADEGHDHAGHDHAGHNEVDSLEISEQARSNIGLKTAKVELRSFQRTIGIPGIIVERPGHSVVQVSAPLGGVVTKIYPILGEALDPGQKLFDIRLTHEELVQAQADFLRTAEELDVIAKEVARIEKLAADGTIAGKTFLERKYDQQRQEAVMRAQHEALLLHGLTEAQIQNILDDRKLFSQLTVVVPKDSTDAISSDAPQQYQVQELRVQRGQQVNAGDPLAMLTDHSQLLIEGNAFEKDGAALAKAVESGNSVSAVISSSGAEPLVIDGLEILYLSGEVDPESRTLHFYVTLPNKLLRDPKKTGDHRFIYWQFRPGQRVELQVPVEAWPDRIVLPVDALAQDGPEAYVFQANGDHFDRRPVHVEYRDQFSVVIANDGSIFPGDLVAISGAPQLQMALKNKSGGAIDPHAGHNH